MNQISVPTATGPLRHLRVLELGHYVSAPFCTRLLADLGADVIKVEAPATGDPMRSSGASAGGQSLWWSSLSRNKRLITLNLGVPEGRDLALDLARQCDVVVENFRPGQLERWGISWDVLREINPRVIFVRISGFGQAGPASERVCFAPIAEAFGGLTYVTGSRADETASPARPNVSLGDSITGLNAFGMLLAALHERDAQGTGTGRGRCIDIAMFESVFAMLDAAVTEFSVTGKIRQPSATTAVFSPSGPFRAGDGAWIVVTASGNAVFQRMAGAMGRADLATDPRFVENQDRVTHREALEDEINAWMKGLDSAQVMAAFNTASVPASKIYSVADCAADEHYRARGTVVELDDPVAGKVLHPGIAARFDDDGSQPVLRWTGRALGADNHAVYQDLLGLSPERLEILRRQGAV